MLLETAIELKRKPSPTKRKVRLRRVSAAPKCYRQWVERFPFAKLRHFGAVRLFRGFNCGISDECWKLLDRLRLDA